MDDDDVGELDPAKQKMAIRDGQPFEQEQDTLLHEVIHGVDHELNLKFSERQVRAFATGLLAVLKDNPKFFSYLRKKK